MQTVQSEVIPQQYCPAGAFYFYLKWAMGMIVVKIVD
jgi:hypothetical protein